MKLKSIQERNINSSVKKKMATVTKLDSNLLEKIITNEIKELIEIFKKYNYELRIAGGAVRDLLMNIIPKDVDLATNATPDEMKIMFENENIRMLNRNGEKHGTITVRINDKENFEITTLRIDVKTDGRHAEVQFTNDWKLDANRRDLTVNSLFLDFNGFVHDYFNGVNDIKNREIHFVGEPDTRIKEDYLRILRYFRFYGRICLSDNMYDNKALEAIRENADGLKTIHGERIWVEFRQIVIGRFSDSLMNKIIELNVHKYIGLPEKPNINEFYKIYSRIKNIKDYHVQPMTMVSSLLQTNNELEEFTKRVRLSNEEKKLSEFILKYRYCDNDKSSINDPLKYYKNILVDFVNDIKIHEKIIQLLLYQDHSNFIDTLNKWSIPEFPIHGDMIASLGIPKGPLFSKIINKLKEIWKNENFNSTQTTLLEHAIEIFKQLK